MGRSRSHGREVNRFVRGARSSGLVSPVFCLECLRESLLQIFDQIFFIF